MATAAVGLSASPGLPALPAPLPMLEVRFEAAAAAGPVAIAALAFAPDIARAATPTSPVTSSVAAPCNTIAPLATALLVEQLHDLSGQGTVTSPSSIAAIALGHTATPAATTTAVVCREAPSGGGNGNEGAVLLPPAARSSVPRLLSRRGGADGQAAQASQQAGRGRGKTRGQAAAAAAAMAKIETGRAERD